ncbi:protein C12orf4-like [Pelomyxa schiedti]|nr:protein C12orf4-like [Pelomyxa schiedti]
MMSGGVGSGVGVERGGDSQLLLGGVGGRAASCASVSLVTPHPMNVVLRFPVGRKLAMANVHLPQEAEACATLHKMFGDEDIPVYLEEPITSAVQALFEEEEKRVIQEKVLSSLLDPNNCFAQIQEWCTAYENENHTWFLQAHQSENSHPSAQQFSEASYSTFLYVASDASTLNAIIVLEDNYCLELSVLRDNRKVAIEGMQKRQLTEMEAAVAGRQHMLMQSNKNVPDTIPLVVARHVREVEEAENEWTRKEESLLSRRRVEYWEMVADLYKKSHARAPSGETVQDTPKSASTLRRFQKSPSPDVPPDCKPLLHSYNMFIGQQQFKVCYTFRLLVGSVAELLTSQWSCSRHRPSARSSDTTIITTSPMSSLGDPQRRRENTLRSLYSSSLTAALIPASSLVTRLSPLQEVVVKQCSLAHEFHFESVQLQLQRVARDMSVPLTRQVTTEEATPNTGSSNSTSPPSAPAFHHLPANSTPNPPRLRPGDFFVTRHSNLLDVHLVFHLHVGNITEWGVSSVNEEEGPLSWLSSIIGACGNYDVSHLILPVFFCEPPQDTPDSVLIKQVEAVIRHVKGVLASTTMNVKSVTFVLSERFTPQMMQSLSHIF